MYKVLLYYKYTTIKDPVALMWEQKLLCEKLNLKGRIIIAREGINGTLEGKGKDISKYIDIMRKSVMFSDIDFKTSKGDGNSFPKLSVKVREEIVSTHLENWDVNANETTGKYITVEQLHEWIKTGRNFTIVDMRNDFEQEVGHFQGSILPGFSNFRDLPKVLPKLEHLKGETIVTVCTGGVRCEKASGFLVKHGFSDVYQLFGGIVTYMEKYPNEDFLGSLYVFDGRIVMGFGRDDPGRKIVGECVVCKQSSEHYINCSDIFCNRHFICCESCAKKVSTCPMGCRDYSQDPKYLARTSK